VETTQRDVIVLVCRHVPGDRHLCVRYYHNTSQAQYSLLRRQQVCHLTTPC